MSQIFMIIPLLVAEIRQNLGISYIIYSNKCLICPVCIVFRLMLTNMMGLIV